ncbi:MAG: hypothetical protein IJP27_03270 [Clostridia bacterium]|nr:hypothetical protein [Clostridia bacterium]
MKRRIEMAVTAAATVALLGILFKADPSPSLRLWCVILPALFTVAGTVLVFMKRDLSACWCYAAACAAFGFGLLQNSTVAAGLRTASLWQVAPLGMLFSAAVLPLFLLTRNAYLRAMLGGLSGATTMLFLMPSISFMILCMQYMGGGTALSYRAAALQGGALLALLASQAIEAEPITKKPEPPKNEEQEEED